MTSLDRGQSRAAADDLPPALASMWRLCKLGYQHEPRLLVTAFLLALLAALPDALMALWLALLGDGLLEGRRGLVYTAAVALGVSAAATWFLRTVSTRVQRGFRDKVTIALESHVARLQASVATIAHQERPDYLDRLSVLRNQIFVLDHMYMSLFTTCGWILRLAVTVALLMSIHPALVLLALCAAPTVLTSTWRPAVERAAQERGAPFARLARHLFEVATTATPGKEVRLTGIGPQLASRRRAGMGGLVRSAGCRAVGIGNLAYAGLGLFWILVRRRGHRCLVVSQVRSRGRLACLGRRGAVIRLRRRDCRRNRFSPWHLDGRLTPPRLVGRLRRRARRLGRPARACAADARDPF